MHLVTCADLCSFMKPLFKFPSTEATLYNKEDSLSERLTAVIGLRNQHNL